MTDLKMDQSPILLSCKCLWKQRLQPGWLGLLLHFWIAGCSTSKPEVFFKQGERDVLKMKAIQACHGDFRVLEESNFGPYMRARLECIKRE